MRFSNAKARHTLWQPSQNNSFVPSLSLCSVSGKGQAQGTKPTLAFNRLGTIDAFADSEARIGFLCSKAVKKPSRASGKA